MADESGAVGVGSQESGVGSQESGSSCPDTSCEKVVLSDGKGTLECGMGNFRELLVWRRSQDLALEVYRSTTSFPKEERYRLAAQMRRARSRFLRISRRDAVGREIGSLPAFSK